MNFKDKLIQATSNAEIASVVKEIQVKHKITNAKLCNILKHKQRSVTQYKLTYGSFYYHEINRLIEYLKL